MQNPASPKVISFVIRFVQEEADQTPAPPILRGAIRHVQTSQELLFTNWPDAVEFIQRFVPIQEASQIQESNH